MTSVRPLLWRVSLGREGGVSGEWGDLGVGGVLVSLGRLEKEGRS